MKPDNHTPTVLPTIRIFWRFTKPYPFLFWYGTVGSMIAVIADSVIPQLIIAEAFNRLQQLYSAHLAITFRSIEPYFIAYSVTAVLTMILWQTQAMSVWRYQIRAMQKITEHIFRHIEYMDNKFHADRFGGALVSQATKFVRSYEMLTDIFNWNIVNGVTAFIASLVVLLLFSPVYALVFIGVCAVFFAVMYRQMTWQIPYNTRLSNS